MTTLTVSQVNFFLKSLIEGDGRLQDVCVTGEISNFTDHYRSGHLYFSLKDERSVLKAVMFSSAAKRLQFRPENSMKVMARGRVSVYEASGQYQLYVESMEPQGIGALSLAYEQLKQRLQAEGLFAPEHKRPLPPYPSRIGVITSPTGAAVQDILNITARRWPLAEIVFAPVLVQGEGAPAQLIDAVCEMNRKNACDVILLGRGGGSLEDLWAFNDEGLARAVYASRIPVVSAVGHETDFTICDFVADVRAPTPSAAAELATPDLLEEQSRLSAAARQLRRLMEARVQELRQTVDRLSKDSPLGDAERILTPWRQRFAVLFGRLVGETADQIETRKRGLQLLAGRLDALSPLKVLGRGYSVVTDASGSVVKSGAHLKTGDKLSLRFETGGARVRVEERLPGKGEQ